MWVIYLLPFWQISRWWAFPFPHLRARALINNWIIRTDSPGKKKKKSRVDRKRESDLLHRPSFSISGESSPSSTWSPTTTETGGTQSKKVTDLSTKIASMHRSKQYFFRHYGIRRGINVSDDCFYRKREWWAGGQKERKKESRWSSHLPIL